MGRFLFSYWEKFTIKQCGLTVLEPYRGRSGTRFILDRESYP